MSVIANESAVFYRISVEIKMYSEKNHQCSLFFLKFYFKTKEFDVMHQS